MPTSAMSEVVQYLRGTLLPEELDLTDGQLLECFLSCREPAALEALMKRHGAMVWAVCRRVLGNHHDAEDAFQAAFLVLVRKAASIRTNVGNWLYGVAHQTALRARANRARRQGRERSVTNVPEPAVTERDPWSDLQPLLDQEVRRLPEKYRAAIVLCELEGKALRDAARQLGCPEGTVASRLARARAMLAKRLSRHGLAITGATLAAALSQVSASACVPAAVLSSTIKAVTLVAAGKGATTGAISSSVAALTEGVLKAMFLNKLMKVAAVLLAAVAVVGSGVFLYRTQAAEPGKQEAQAAPAKRVAGAAAPAAPAPPKVPKELLEKRLDVARKVFKQNLTRLKALQALPSELFGWSERWLEAELALTDNQADRVKALRDHLDRTREVEQMTVGLARTGQGRQADAEAATYYRLEAEIRLRKEGVEPHSAKGNKGKADNK
jgi:RNA polymerase sigma factor (sigma-70 family)